MTSSRCDRRASRKGAKPAEEQKEEENGGDYPMNISSTAAAISAPPHLFVRSSRRAFLSDVGMGFAGMALGAMLAKEGVLRGEDVSAKPQASINPKAKNVIWIFLVGGMSHMESLDPKPAL